MSTVTVQLFATYAETFGGATIQVAVQPECTVGDLVATIRALPGAYALPDSPRVAVNRKFADYDQRLGDRDEVALIPPVAGG